MGIIKKDRPSSATLSATSGFSDLLGQNNDKETRGGLKLENEMLEPIPVYSVPGTDMREVSMTSWRHLIWNSNEDFAVSMADVEAFNENADVPMDAFSGVTSGRSVVLLSRALSFVDEAFSDSDEEFEIRILEIPNANSSAVWLKGEKHSHFVPFLDAELLMGEVSIDVDEDYAKKMQTILSSLEPDAGFQTEQ